MDEDFYGRSYVWDYRNRLTIADTRTSGGVLTRSVAFKYDIFDRRIAKTVDLDGAGAGAAVTERYVYDRDHIMLVLSAAGTLKERYLYGANLDQVLAVETSTSDVVNWTLSDYLGTVRDLVSSAGVVQNHIKYDSFGNVTAQSAPSVKSRFGFTGREFDSETGLYYYRSRYYDSAVGRFLSEDPIGFKGSDANLSRYVGNSPITHTDPFGRERVVVVFTGGALTLQCDKSSLGTFLSVQFDSEPDPIELFAIEVIWLFPYRRSSQVITFNPPQTSYSKLLLQVPQEHSYVLVSGSAQGTEYFKIFIPTLVQCDYVMPPSPPSSPKKSKSLPQPKLTECSKIPTLAIREYQNQNV